MESSLFSFFVMLRLAAPLSPCFSAILHAALFGVFDADYNRRTDNITSVLTTAQSNQRANR
jgi:hypothetical protein